MPLSGSTCLFNILICYVFYCHVTQIVMRDGTFTPRIQLPSLIIPSTQYLSSQTQVLSRDLPDLTRWIITRHITVIHLTGPHFPPVAPPYLPVAPRRIQTTSTSSPYQPCHTSDYWFREEGGSLLSKRNTRPISVGGIWILFNTEFVNGKQVWTYSSPSCTFSSLVTAPTDPLLP
jgi:hypothetical protein